MSIIGAEASDLDTENRERRTPCVLLLDTSSSMSGAPIKALNEGLRTFEEELHYDRLAAMRMEVAVISFGSKVMDVIDFVDGVRFTAPALTASGGTSMGQALHHALDRLRARKDEYTAHHIPYNRPMIILITDGSPTDDWKPAAARLKAEYERKGVMFYAVGVEGADFATLARIAPDPEYPPVPLKGLEFAQFFVWLSASITAVTGATDGIDTQMPPIDWSA